MNRTYLHTYENIFCDDLNLCEVSGLFGGNHNIQVSSWVSLGDDRLIRLVSLQYNQHPNVAQSV